MVYMSLKKHDPKIACNNYNKLVFMFLNALFNIILIISAKS